MLSVSNKVGNSALIRSTTASTTRLSIAALCPSDSTALPFEDFARFSAGLGFEKQEMSGNNPTPVATAALRLGRTGAQAATNAEPKDNEEVLFSLASLTACWAANINNGVSESMVYEIL